ncbi:hypothetical protein phi1422_0053 [Bdellovibrio phage phi1422]|uniref:head protein n=1 Tax=Bdellovibrio phage phi1422 TaxID=1127515 RepID=UPI0002536D69|nr:head protein [Bdellovibrio phage phi1422]AFC22573.1 hypothetical protein phi1422_0053 [Bdellovibrio phage phi1422]
MIFNAKNIPLNQMTPSSVPNMSETLSSWMQKMVFNLITKTNVDFEIVETTTDINFMGVWQPFTFQQLQIKPISQRAWKWFTVHSQTQLLLKVDDVVKYKGGQYRVMELGNYNEYGFYEYHLVQDSTGAGPTVIVPPAPEPEPPVAPLINDGELPW